MFKKAPLRDERIDVNETIIGVIELVRYEASKHDVSVQTVFGEGLPKIRGDRVQFQQVILNLMVNAIESMSATSDGRRDLSISTAADLSNAVSIVVRDSGPGLPAQDIDRIFDPFYTTKPGGLGMGLSICRSIADAYGGRLSARPNVPRGTVFHFTVPLCPESPIQTSG